MIHLWLLFHSKSWTDVLFSVRYLEQDKLLENVEHQQINYDHKETIDVLCVLLCSSQFTWPLEGSSTLYGMPKIKMGAGEGWPLACVDLINDTGEIWGIDVVELAYYLVPNNLAYISIAKSNRGISERQTESDLIWFYFISARINII